MTYINIYKNNPTAGGTDGTAVSTDGAQTSPVSVTLDASQSESKTIKLAVRTDSGYTTSGDTTLYLIGNYDGEYAGRWSLCKTENDTFANSITFTSAITNTNTIFYAKATSDSEEAPTQETDTQIVVNAEIASV